MWKELKAGVADHFELTMNQITMIIVFAFGAVMLARFPMSEEMGRWVETAGMAVIGYLSRGIGQKAANRNTDSDVAKDKNSPGAE